MDIERFILNLEQLLCDGDKSRATDFLIEFLLDTNGKPTSLGLPDWQTLSHKSSAEIVAFLRASLNNTPPEPSKGGPDADWYLWSDDLSLIEETAESIESQTQTYLIDEESIDATAARGTSESIRPISGNGKIANSVNDGLHSTFDGGGELEQGLNEYPASEILAETGQFQRCDTQAKTLLEELELDRYLTTEEFGFTSKDDFEVEEIDNDSLEIEIFAGSATEVEFPEFALDDLDDSEDFEDPDHFLEELPDEDRLSLADRALQVAIAVGLKYELGRADIEFLQQVFMEHGWGNARIAIAALLSRGTTIHEVRLAKQMKDIWSDRSDFWIGFYQSRRDTSYYTYESARILSWAFAAKFIRIFPQNIEFDEIEYFIDESYDIWWNHKRKFYLKFIDYLKEMSQNLEPGECYLDLMIKNDSSYLDTEIDNRIIYGSSLHCKLNHLGLMPEIWVNEFDQRQSSPDPAVMNDYFGSRSNPGKGGHNG